MSHTFGEKKALELYDKYNECITGYQQLIKEIKAPEIKALEIKAPEIKAPEISFDDCWNKNLYYSIIPYNFFV